MIRIAFLMVCLLLLGCGGDKAVVADDLPIIVNDVRLVNHFQSSYRPYARCVLDVTNNAQGSIRANITMELKTGDDVLETWQETRYIARGRDTVDFDIDISMRSRITENSQCHLKRIESATN